MEKTKIKIGFKTEHGHEYETYTEALVSDRLYKGLGYCEEYKLRQLVTIILDNFTVKERKQKEDETLPTSKGS